MIFTGYSILAFFLANKKDYFPEVPVQSLFAKEIDQKKVESQNYIYHIGTISNGDFQPLLFLKQSKNFNRMNLLALNTENEVYKYLDLLPKNHKIKKLQLIKKDFDRDKNLLVFEYSKGQTLKRGLLTYSLLSATFLAQNLSTTLAEYHRTLTSTDNLKNPHFIFYKPGIFALSTEFIRNAEKISKINARIKMKGKILSKKITDIFDRIYPHINEIHFSQDTLIHNDIRQENFFKDADDYKLIDWESACWGDKYWDLACLLDIFLQKSDKTTTDWLSYTKVAIKIIWDNYHQIMGLPINEDNLKKTIQYIGLKRLDVQLRHDDDDAIPELAELVEKPKEAEYRGVNIWKTLINN